MSSNMAGSCFSTSASGTVTFAPESLLTATHWRCCRSLGPTSRRIGTPCMKTKRLFVLLNPLICRFEGWMKALWPWAPSGWTSIQGSSCPGGRSSPWRLLPAGHSGTWSTGSTEPACPALRGKPWSHRGWWQPGKNKQTWSVSQSSDDGCLFSAGWEGCVYLQTGHPGRQHQALVVSMDHCEGTDGPGWDSPGVLEGKLLLSRLFWVFKYNLKHLREVLTKMMGCSTLRTHNQCLVYHSSPSHTRVEPF